MKNNKTDLIDNLIKRCDEAKKNSFDFLGVNYIKEADFDSTKRFVITNLKSLGIDDSYIREIEKKNKASVSEMDTIIKYLTDIKTIMDKKNNKKKTVVLKENAVFLCHASADKDACVEKIYNELTKYGIKIFYDKNSIGWGSRLTTDINRGLKNSEFAIVIISKNFIGRDWTDKELTKLFKLENKTKQKIILPVLFGITIEKITKIYPGLKDIHAITYSNNAEQIACLFIKEYIKRLTSIINNLGE